MSGSVRYRDGAWRLTVQADRRRHYATVHAPNNRTGRKQATDALAALVVEVNSGQHLGDHTTTVAQALDAWHNHHAPNVEAGTANNYRQAIDHHITPHLGHHRLHKLRPHHIDALYATLRQQGLAPKTIRNIAGTLHTALNQAVRWGWIARNPATQAEPPTAKRRPITVPTAAQVLAVTQHARPDFAAMIRLAATTGHRRGSLLALRWTDVDLDTGQVTFARAIANVNGDLIEKGTKVDRVDRSTLGPVTLEVLRQHRARCAETALACGRPLPPDAFLFHQDVDHHRPWHPGGVNRRWATACAKAGVSGVRFHDVKHFAATQMLSAGVPPHVVAQRTGTSAETLQRIYAHHLPRADEAAAELMDRLLG